ncbi:MAG: tRNA-uridine aminocarboxypropyltransferase [Bdellovibrionales bacterium]
MLARKRKTKNPCPGCSLHLQRCICSLIPTLSLRTHVALIVHAKELKRTTNSGRLAVKSLLNSSLHVRGLGPLDLSPLLSSEYRSVLFYPSDDAVELTPEFVAESGLPIQLIVPDGNWRQASKVASRHPELASLPRVKISAANTARHHLRAEIFPEGMSTLEAIARALRVIEGDVAFEPLMALYRAKLHGTLLGRGVVISAGDSV